MQVWVAFVFDYFMEQGLPIGVFSTEEKAERALDIALSIKKAEDPEMYPDGRYNWFIYETRIDEYIKDTMDIMVD